MKMDVEGFESEVLKGAEATARNPDLLAVIVETNGDYQSYGYDLRSGGVRSRVEEAPTVLTSVVQI